MRVETPSIHAWQITAHLGLVHPPAQVEQGREERPRAKLGDRQLDLPGGGGHRLGPRAIAPVGALRRALVAPRADHGGGLEPRPGPAAQPEVLKRLHIIGIHDVGIYRKGFQFLFSSWNYSRFVFLEYLFKFIGAYCFFF